MSFDPEKAEGYYNTIKENIKQFYISKGMDPQQAEKIAEGAAAKVIFRKFGPDNARRFFKWRKRRS